ncbi:MAG: cobalamin-dependent protein [Candidatus Eremiobacteraeota bacterium]|nr:cobalamin-dependent protein [Candidatus Eremiobacteraeota bacterium]
MKALFITGYTEPDSSYLYQNDHIQVQSHEKLPDISAYLLSSVLNKNHVENEIFELNSFQEDEIKRMIQACGNFDCVLISSNSLQWATNKRIIDKVRKEHKGITVIVGGIHPTLFDEHILNTTTVDFCVRGEAEKSLAMLLGWLRKKKGDLSTIPGISYKGDGEVVRYGDAKPLRDKELDQLPCIDYSSLPRGKYSHIPIETSRGDAYYNPFDEIPHHKLWRAMSPTGIYEGIRKAQEYLDRVNSDYVYIIDEHFTAKEKRIFDFAKVMRKNRAKIETKIIFKTRCTDFLYGSLAEYIGEFTHKIIMEPICGYNRGLMRIKRGYTTEVIEDTARILSRYIPADSIEYRFMTGIPGETEKEADRTVKFAGNLQDKYGVNTGIIQFSLLPGSIYFREKYEKGEIHPSIFDELAV